MGRFKVYLKPFKDDGTYQADWTEITDYVVKEKIGTLESAIDATDFQLGIFRNSSVTLALNNRDGLFSDFDQPQSLFRYKRQDSLVKVEYNAYERQPLWGMATAGDSETATVWDPVEVFRGIVTDEGLSENVRDDQLVMTVLGLESILARAIVPFGTLSVGDTVSEVIFACLNQPLVKSVLTVDPANISVGIEQALESISGLQHKTVREAMDTLLLCSNSVLVVESGTIYVKGRTATPDVKRIFRGQASSLGPENIADLRDIKNGLSRTFNYFTWRGNAAANVTNTTSSTKYGIKKKELDKEIFTVDPTLDSASPNTAKQNAVLNSLLAEFGMPKREMTLVTDLNLEMLELTLLDRVAIDYPTVYIPNEGEMPICGVTPYDVGVLPDEAWGFMIDTTTNFKIISRKILATTQMMEFRLREI